MVGKTFLENATAQIITLTRLNFTKSSAERDVANASLLRMFRKPCSLESAWLADEALLWTHVLS